MNTKEQQLEALDRVANTLRLEASGLAVARKNELAMKQKLADAEMLQHIRDQIASAEPVAWRYKAWPGDAEFSICLHDPAEFRDPSISCVQELFTAPTAPATPRVPDELTDKQVVSACFSYRHDYGLLDDKARSHLEFQCREWWRGIRKELQQPSQHPMVLATLAAAPEPRND